VSSSPEPRDRRARDARRAEKSRRGSPAEEVSVYFIWWPGHRHLLARAAVPSSKIGFAAGVRVLFRALELRRRSCVFARRRGKTRASRNHFARPRDLLNRPLSTGEADRANSLVSGFQQRPTALSVRLIEFVQLMCSPLSTDPPKPSKSPVGSFTFRASDKRRKPPERFPPTRRSAYPEGPSPNPPGRKKRRVQGTRRLAGARMQRARGDV